MRFGSHLLTFVLHITTYKSATAGISDYIRISDGYSLWSDDISGRVEVFIDNRWGTVCDDNFGLDEANLVCQLLGYPGGGIPICCAHFYGGYGPIYNGSIDCLPHTTNHSECLSPGWGVNNCTHSQDVGVSCGPQYEIASIRLVDGYSAFNGHLEILHANRWGSVCAYFGVNEANAACRQLGFPEGRAALTYAYTAPRGMYWHLLLVCPVGAANLSQCARQGFYHEYCSNYVSISCYGQRLEGPIRLVGGAQDLYGRVEVFYYEWGTIASGLLANTVCRQLGFPEGGIETDSAPFGQALGPMWASDVVCSADAVNLSQCSFLGWGVHDYGCYWYNGADLAVICKPQRFEGSVRLMDGVPGRSGRLEIFHDNEWGTVCDTGFGPTQARFVCQHLGLLSANAKPLYNVGGSNETIWADYVQCTHNATNLSECLFPGWGVYNCTHADAVGVSCEILEGPIRLVGGFSDRTGRLEIFHDYEWGSFCQNYFGSNEAKVVCRQLGFTEGGVLSDSTHFGQGSGLIWRTHVSCPATAANLSECWFDGWNKDQYSCPTVNIICESFEGAIRLVDGDSERSGRLEILHDNEWGTVCDDNFSSEEASLVCKQLGFGMTGVSHCCASFGEGNGTIWADHIQCPHYATNLSECSFQGWGVHNCTHESDVGVTCQILEGPLRLVGGAPSQSGRLEIFHDNKWGTVCDNHFGTSEANTVCRQLGYPEGGVAYSYDRFGQGSGPIWADDVNCPPGATNLTECSFRGWGVHNCAYYEDVGVLCDPQVLEGPIRLVGGAPGQSGRLEIFHDNEWGTVCDNNFGTSEANAVCRQLGLNTHASVVHNHMLFGEGNGTIWADNVECEYEASDLSQCIFTGWGVHSCTHGNDIGIICHMLEGSIRLVGGVPDTSGRLEIFHDNQWGTVCDDYFGTSEANTVCRQFGFPEGGLAYSNAHFGQGSGLIWADEVSCPPGATNLTECSFRGWGEHDCDHYEDVGVLCDAQVLEGPIRLMDGVPGRSGRLEIFHDNEWGTVCGNRFRTRDATVVCQQLGLTGAAIPLYNATFGEGNGTIWADSIDCSYDALDLSQCSFPGRGVHNCTHEDDVGVSCEVLEGPIRLVDGVPGQSGRLEIFHDNQWGTVCGQFYAEEASAVCRQLGFGTAGEAHCCAQYGAGNGTIWAGDIDCWPATTNLNQCVFEGWGVHSCSHGNDVGVSCQVFGGSVRLVGGASDRSGRLEILHENQWGTLCYDYFSANEANAMCRQLGFAEGGIATCGDTSWQDSGKFWAVRLDCPVGTINISECLFDGWGNQYCSYYGQQAVLTCLGNRYLTSLPVTTTRAIGTDTTTSQTVRDRTTSSSDHTRSVSTDEITSIHSDYPISSSTDRTTSAFDRASSTGDDTSAHSDYPMSFSTDRARSSSTDYPVSSSTDRTTSASDYPVSSSTDRTTSSSDHTRSSSTGATTNSPADYPMSSLSGKDGCDYGSAICEHICTPIDYSMNFTCSCESGYGLKADGVSCRGPCPAGTYVTGDTCVPCPHGQYQQYQEKPKCDSCPEGYNTSVNASTSSSQCMTLCALAFGRCENGGRCVDDGELPSCDCRVTGFTGQTCVIDIDECSSKPCEHGGQCTNTPGGYECECPKEERTTYAGANCTEVVTETKTPVMSSVFPLYGPLAGGTNITIHGKNFDRGFRPVRLLLNKTSNCPVWESNDTYLVATTPAGQDLYVDAQLPIDVVFEGGLTISTGKSFVYRANPEITALYPNNTLLEGGSTITVNGKRLTSVDTPYLEITMELTIRTFHETFDVISEIIKDVFVEKCDVLTDEMAECLTPVIRVPPTFNASDDKSTLLLYIGFVLDGFDNYRNLENTSLDSSRTLGYVATHNMEPLSEVFVYNGGPLRLKGAHIDDGDDAKYSVLIGQGDCPITDRTSTLIECTVPSPPPPKLPHSTSKHHRITLSILRSVNYTMGEVQYPPERDLVIGLAVGAAAILAALAIIVIVVIVKKRRSGKDSGSKMDDWVVLPALPTHNGDDASSGESQESEISKPTTIDYIRMKRDRVGDWWWKRGGANGRLRDMWMYNSHQGQK